MRRHRIRAALLAATVIVAGLGTVVLPAAPALAWSNDFCVIQVHGVTEYNSPPGVNPCAYVTGGPYDSVRAHGAYGGKIPYMSVGVYDTWNHTFGNSTATCYGCTSLQSGVALDNNAWRWQYVVTFYNGSGQNCTFYAYATNPGNWGSTSTNNACANPPGSVLI